MGNSGNILRSMLCFLSMDLPKPFVLQRADEDFLYTTDYFISFWDEPALVELLCGEFLDTVLPFDCDRPVNRDVRVVALMVLLLYAGFTQVREW